MSQRDNEKDTAIAECIGILNTTLQETQNSIRQLVQLVQPVQPGQPGQPVQPGSIHRAQPSPSLAAAQTGARPSPSQAVPQTGTQPAPTFNFLRGIPSPVTPLMHGSVPVNRAINALFHKGEKPDPGASSSSLLPDKGKGKGKGKNDFFREVILLRKPTIEATLDKDERSKHNRLKLIVKSFHFNKAWSELRIKEEIASKFQDKLQGQNFTLLLPENKELIEPQMHHAELNGSEICRMFNKKTVYVRPDVRLISLPDSECEIDEIDTTEDSSSDVFKPKRPKRRKVHVSVSSSDDEDVIPETTENEQNQIEKDYAFAVSLSLTSPPPSPQKDPSSGSTALDIINAYREQARFVNSTTITATRSRPFESIERYVLRGNFNIWDNFSVTFVGETGVDTGGLRREFLDLAIAHLKDSVMFTGEGVAKQLVMSLTSLQRRHYYIAGATIILSILHGGPTPSFLHPKLYDRIVGKQDIDWQVEDITDSSWKAALQDLQEAGTKDEKERILGTHQIFQILKVDPLLTSIEESEKIIADCVHYFFDHHLAPPLMQLTEGLCLGGLLDAIKKKPLLFENILVGKEIPLTKEILMANISVIRDSDKESARYLQETEVVANWLWLLEELQDGVQHDEMRLTLQHVLQFAAGISSLPVEGKLQKNIDITFSHDTGKVLPEAHVCDLTLELPVIVSYDDFRSYMLLALKYGRSFEKV